MRERIQRQAQGDSSVVTKPAQARDIAGGMCTADSSQDLKSLKRNREDIDILCEESGCEATAKVHRADSSLYLLKLPRFIKFALIKKNIEQAEATRLLSDTMRKIVEHYDLAPGESIGDLFSSGLLDKSSVHALSVSGTKDKRGITSQWCCLEVLPSWINKALSLDQKSACVIESLSNDQRRYVRILEAAAACILNVNTGNLGHDGIRVGDIEYSHSGLNLGQHWGNRFEIVIRNVVLSSSKQMDKSTCLVCNIRSGILESLENRKGFPNYFGSQRFGLVPNYCTDAPVSEEEKKEHSDNLIAESGVTEPIFCDESTTNRIPTGPQIGKYLIQCDFRSAVHCILLGNEYHFDPTTNTVVELGSWVCDSCVNLGKICTTELRNKKAMAVRLAREKYADGAAPSLVAKMLPGHMTKEKWLLQGLVRYCGDNNGLIGSLRTKQCISCQLKSGLFEKIDSNPKKSPGSLSTENDYQRAIEAVPYAARTIWIHAYGSWLWNKVAEYRLFNLVESAELPRTNCQFGDLVFDTDQKANRIQKKISQIDSNTSISSVVLPLMGSSVMFPGGDTGRCDTVLNISGVLFLIC